MLAGNKGPTLHTQSFSHILSKRAELESQCPLDGLYSRWPDFIFRTQEQHMATMGIRKGQLISKGHFGVFKSTKKPTNFV